MMSLDEHFQYNGNYKGGEKDYDEIGRTVCRTLSAITSVSVEGRENLVKEGRAFEIGTHLRGVLDPCDLVNLHYDKQLSFAVNKEWCDTELAVKTYLEHTLPYFAGKTTPFFQFLLKPIAYVFFSTISPRMIKAGQIPVDIRGGDNTEALDSLKEYIAKHQEGTFVFLQYQKKPKKNKKEFFLVSALKEKLNPKLAVSREPIIRRKGFRMIVDLYDDGRGIDIPITLIALRTNFHKTFPFFRTRIQIAPPEYVSTYAVPGDSDATFARSHEALETKLKEMYRSLKLIKS